MTARAQARNVKGVVIDGRCRDLSEHRTAGFPVRFPTISHRSLALADHAPNLNEWTTDGDMCFMSLRSSLEATARLDNRHSPVQAYFSSLSPFMQRKMQGRKILMPRPSPPLLYIQEIMS